MGTSHVTGSSEMILSAHHLAKIGVEGFAMLSSLISSRHGGLDPDLATISNGATAA